MTIPLLPFRESIVCSKCAARFRLFPDTCEWVAAGAVRDGFDYLPECLLVKCPVCKFMQIMAPADAPKAPEDPRD